MAEGLSLHGRKERLNAATTLETDELRRHQEELTKQLAAAYEQGIIRWQHAITPMLAAIAFELGMREPQAPTSDELAPVLAKV